jgi:hypothetical protein
MFHVPANLFVISHVLLIVDMTVAIGKPIHYSSAICNAKMYNNAFESLLFISNNCKIVHVTICVLNLSLSEHCMFHVLANLFVINRVLLIVKMTVAIGKPIHYSSAICNAKVYNNAFESLLFISNNCKIVHVTVCVQAFSSSKKYSIAYVIQYDCSAQ